MRFHSYVLAALLAVATVSDAQAEDKASACVVTTTRNACAGQEAESYKKCEGKKSCSKNVEAATAEACATAATNACSNDRLEITQSKTVTAKFQGKALKTKGGQEDMCLDYPKRDAEFNKCAKK
jgi:uncharacterized protein (DUF2147 family)